MKILSDLIFGTVCKVNMELIGWIFLVLTAICLSVNFI